MSQGLVERQNLEDISDAIRSKNGSSDTYTPAEMAQAISGIHTADEVVLVQKTVNANGQYNASDDSADGYSRVMVNVPNSYSASDEGKVVSNGNLVSQTTKQIMANGTHDTTTNNSVAVDVPNSYAAADEGKVVSGGALVGQTSRNITDNGTYDTTENNEVVVDVSGGAALGFIGGVRGSGAFEFNIKDMLFGKPNNYLYPTDDNGDILTPDWSLPFEIKLRFKMTSTKTAALFGSQGNYYYAPSVECRPARGEIWCGLSTSGNRWEYNNLFSNIVIAIDTFYTIKAVWDGINYRVIFNDGIEDHSWVISPSNNPFQNGANFQLLGIQADNNLRGSNAIIDIKKSSITLDGVKVWGEQ